MSVILVRCAKFKCSDVCTQVENSSEELKTQVWCLEERSGLGIYICELLNIGRA